MNSTRDTVIEADPTTPAVRIIREFDAPPEAVSAAWTDPELVVQWLGPRNTTMEIDTWDATTGGHYRYRHLRDGQELAAFFGSFHEIRPGERLVQTFTWEGMPDGVSLDSMVFEPLDGGRTRMVAVSLVDSFETRDAIMAGGMSTGVTEGYQKLDELLARTSA